MESYELLTTIYEISKQDPKPESYPCKGYYPETYAGLEYNSAASEIIRGTKIDHYKTIRHTHHFHHYKRN